MFPRLITISEDFFLPTYGVMVAIGFLVALWLAGKLAQRSGLDPDKVTNLGVWSALVGLIGAKLLMFVVEFDHYRTNPSEIFSLATLQAGGVFYGGLVLALIYAAWYLRHHKLPVAMALDCFAPGLAIGQAIGRVGCFAAGCCWGQACDRSWAVTFRDPEANRLTGVPLGEALHPTQLYEAFLLGIVALATWRYFGSNRQPGAVMGLYLVMAGAGRFTVEFFRVHQQALPWGGPLSIPQWISLALALLGLAVLAIRRAPEPARS
jgi:phosphatidylglycerol:prolipoprotein diacylglycerol transferase